MNKQTQILKYIVSDFLSAIATWTLFYIYRKLFIESKVGINLESIQFTSKFYYGIVLIPFFWLLFYSISGYYRNLYRKSRLIEFGETFLIALIGAVIIFFSSILDDTISSYLDYYHSFFMLLGLQFFLTYIPRAIITHRTIKKIRKRQIGFNTILVGSGNEAAKLYADLEKEKESSGFKFIGFVHIQKKTETNLPNTIQDLGDLKMLKDIILQHKIEEVLIAPETHEHVELKKILNILKGTNVFIKVIANLYDSLTGIMKMNALDSVSLFEIRHELLPAWQENLKRLLDILIAFIALIILTPVYIALSIGVRLSSPGPIFYTHERIGRYGEPFSIYKFRSMYVDAEKNGPALSSKNDSRITPFGLLMRKTRLDELPQFYNVLIGDMSLVGPRPERQYFINQIIKRAPQYSHLQKIRPGITSLGQVKYGYAENVDEMITRMKFDLFYLENMSLYFDFKIMIYTVKTMVKAMGK